MHSWAIVVPHVFEDGTHELRFSKATAPASQIAIWERWHGTCRASFVLRTTRIPYDGEPPSLHVPERAQSLYRVPFARVRAELHATFRASLDRNAKLGNQNYENQESIKAMALGLVNCGFHSQRRPNVKRTAGTAPAGASSQAARNTSLIGTQLRDFTRRVM